MSSVETINLSINNQVAREAIGIIAIELFDVSLADLEHEIDEDIEERQKQGEYTDYVLLMYYLTMTRTC